MEETKQHRTLSDNRLTDSLAVNVGCDPSVIQDKTAVADIDTDRDTSAHVDMVTDEHTPVDVSEVAHIGRTRAGRVVKKVHRLIETMVQRPFSIQGSRNSFTRKFQSLLSLF